MAKKQTAGRDKLGALAPKFAELNDDVLFGEVWSREEQLSARDRSMVTIAALFSAGLYPQLKSHLALGKEHGITKEEAVEICHATGILLRMAEGVEYVSADSGSVWRRIGTGTYEKTVFIVMAALLLLGMTACGNSMEQQLSQTENIEQEQTVTENTQTEIDTVDDEQRNNLSGTIPDELEYIPDGYRSPSEHSGTLEKLTYQTWESFSYEDHAQELTKDPYNFAFTGITQPS